MNSFWSWQLRTGAVVAAAALLGGCAQERDPINRVQANALSKSFFIGEDFSDIADDPEFYTAATVIDVPYGADSAQAFPGLTGGLRRIKWEVTESFLNARMTYESIDGVDGHGSRTTDNGRVIASFAISKHFDIKRAYNSSTGEELNVVDENTSDAPWYERRFFRVDWSQNHQTSSFNWDPLSLYMSLDDADTEPVSYYVEDPKHPDAPHFDVDDGYFDVTNKIYFSPKSITLSGQTLPACFYRGSLVVGATAPWGNCESSEVTVRMSFKRIAHEGEPGFTDYQPIHWDGARMNAFGLFTTDRLGWDRHYGILDDQWNRFGQRYNIWAQSHVDVPCASQDEFYNGVDPQRDFDSNGTADACESAGAGSQCDTFAGKCTMPYAARETRPIRWYYVVPDPNGDDTIFNSTKKATWQWDTAIRIAVLAARLVECRRTNGASLGGTPFAGADSCESVFGWDQADDAEARNVERWWRAFESGGDTAPFSNTTNMEPLVVLCHSPVEAGDHSACGQEGLVTRPGDIRYHQVAVWPTRHSLSPWGYGPSNSDPLTGEIISAGINVYDAVTDSAAQSYLDQLLWLNGELKSEDITSGDYVRGWGDTPSARTPGSSFQQMDKEELDRRTDGLRGSRKTILDKARLKSFKSQINLRDLSKSITNELHARRAPPDILGSNRGEFEARIDLAKNSPIEGQLMNPMWSQMAGLTQEDPLSGDNLDLASPLRGMRGSIVLEGQNKLSRQLARVGQCILQAPQPTGLPGFAKIMAEKFPPVDPATSSPGEQKDRVVRMQNYLRDRMNYSVILHEMGHTVGLRHNFTGSYDKFNYRPQYWQLRTRGGTVTEPCNGPVADGADCLGPRYYDPLTPEESDNAIWMWQHTTVMDYPGDLTQDMLGLGVYDYAAMRFFYADVIDVRNDGVFLDTTLEGEEIVGLVDRAGGVTGQWVFKDANTFLHYSEWNNFFGLLWNCREAPAELTSPPPWWNEEVQGRWHPVFDGMVVRNEICDRAPVDFVGWRELRPDTFEDDLNVDPKYFTPSRRRDFNGRPRMPYAFESDEYADGWSPSTYRHDNGADMYEEVLFHSNLYEDRHVFDNFRNGRVNFTIYGAYLRALGRYHAKIANLGQGMAFMHDFYWKEIAKNQGFSVQDLTDAYEGEGGPMRDHAIAATMAFDHFVRVITRPHTGPHYRLTLDPLFQDSLVRPREDVIGASSQWSTVINIPSGSAVTTGGDRMLGGRPINNEFQFGEGYWSSDYLNQAGSYYEKTYAIQSLMEASYRAINFFRFDGLDARFRHVNYTNLFPGGMRRLVGLLLTEDYEVFAPRLQTQGGAIMKEQSSDGVEYPSMPMGWVSFVGADDASLCFPGAGKLTCSDTQGMDLSVGGNSGESVPVDPQIGYEVQKFVAFWAYVYMPGREQLDWVDMMRIYQIGGDNDPSYLPGQRIEWRDADSGKRYVARRFGDENIMGHTYDKGIAAKMLQWANKLAARAYKLDPVEPFDPATGAANYLLDADGQVQINDENPGMTPSDPNNLTCDDNVYCQQLRKYRGLIDFMRDTASQLGFPEPSLQVIEPD